MRKKFSIKCSTSVYGCPKAHPVRHAFTFHSIPFTFQISSPSSPQSVCSSVGWLRSSSGSFRDPLMPINLQRRMFISGTPMDPEISLITWASKIEQKVGECCSKLCCSFFSFKEEQPTFFTHIALRTNEPYNFVELSIPWSIN